MTGLAGPSGLTLGGMAIRRRSRAHRGCLPAMPFRANFRVGSYPKSAMALEALWMLELPSQRGFRECAQHHVSRPGIPSNVEGTGWFDSLGRNVASGEVRRARGLAGPPSDTSRHHGRLPVLWGTHNSLMQDRLSAITLLGQEPKEYPAGCCGSANQQVDAAEDLGNRFLGPESHCGLDSRDKRVQNRHRDIPTKAD